jgi:hypothetical protein
MSKTPPTPEHLALVRYRHVTKPWWADHIPQPDIRGLATVGMFCLIAYLLWLIANVEVLAKNELFKTVATLLVGSGAFGLVCSYIWGGSKASVAAADTVNAMARSTSSSALTAPSSGTQNITVTTPAAAPLPDASIIQLRDAVTAAAAAHAVPIAQVTLAEVNEALAAQHLAEVTADRLTKAQTAMATVGG